MNKISTKLVTVVTIVATIGTALSAFKPVSSDELKGRYDDTMKAVDSAINTIKGKNAEAIGKMKAKIDHLNKQIADGNTDMEDLQKAKDAVDEELKQKKADLEQKTKDLEQAEKDNESKDSEIAKLKEDKAKLEKDVEDLESAKADLEESVADLTDKVAKLESKKAELEAEIKAYEQEVADANSKIDGMNVEGLDEQVQAIIDEYNTLNSADAKLAEDVQLALGEAVDNYDADLEALVDGYVDTNAGTDLGTVTLKLSGENVECVLSYDAEGFYVNGSKLGMSMGEGYVYPASSSRQTAKVAIFNTTDNYLSGYQNSVTQVYSGSVQAGMNGFVDKDGAKGYAMSATYQNGSQKKDYTNPNLWKNFFVGVFGVSEEQWAELQNDWNFELLQPTHK